MTPTGIHREKGGWGKQHAVLVRYGGTNPNLYLPEDEYRARGYMPPFEELPWHGDPPGDA